MGSHTSSSPASALDRPRLAYLVSEYPTLSHAFIENEVEALRADGVEVHTFSVRPTSPEQHRSARSLAEARSTTVLLDRGRAVEHARGLFGAPPGARGLLAGARTAARRGGDAKTRVWQGFYLAEALVLLAHMRRLGLRHVHVHFANNGADIARLAVAVGLAQDGPDSGWRWTMSMHGPTEFEAVDAFDLPAKTASADAVACISDFCRGQLMRHSDPRHWAKLGVVRMAVDVDRFSDRSGERRDRSAGDPLRVLFVGRLVPEKGPSVLLDAVAALRSGPNRLALEVRIVGNGPLRDALAAQVAAQGTADVVDLVGPLGNSELPEQYAWADVFCLPSFSEGVPVVLMEAMATGLPVVTSPIAGIPELVRDGVSGHLVPSGRADELARVLRELAALGSAGRATMGQAGRARVGEEFGAKLNVERLRRTLSL